MPQSAHIFLFQVAGYRWRRQEFGRRGVRGSSTRLLFLSSGGDAAESLSSLSSRRLRSYAAAKANWRGLEHSSSVHSSCKKMVVCKPPTIQAVCSDILYNVVNYMSDF